MFYMLLFKSHGWNCNRSEQKQLWKNRPSGQPPFCTESVRKFAASLTQMYSKLNTCYMHVYVCMCICVNIHVCVYMYVHVHMYMHVEHGYM